MFNFHLCLLSSKNTKYQNLLVQKQEVLLPLTLAYTGQVTLTRPDITHQNSNPFTFHGYSPAAIPPSAVPDLERVVGQRPPIVLHDFVSR